MNNQSAGASNLLSIIIPVFREAGGLCTMLDTVCQAVSEFRDEVELVVVDDGSDDETWQALVGYKGPVAVVRGVRLSRNFGKEAALCAGLEVASGAAVVTMDGDLQHPPELIPEMVRFWRDEGFDIVEAVKRSRGSESTLSRIRANGFYSVLNRLSGFNLRDASDFKLMDRRAVDALRSLGERNLFFRGMSNWIGFKRKQIEFDVADRVEGESKWSALSLAKLATTAISAFSALPLQLVTVLGAFFLVFSAVLGIQTLANWWGGSAIDGFTTVIVLQLFIGSVVMISLGIIGVYVSRIYTEVKKRPRFIVADQMTSTEE